MNHRTYPHQENLSCTAIWLAYLLKPCSFCWNIVCQQSFAISVCHGITSVAVHTKRMFLASFVESVKVKGMSYYAKRRLPYDIPLKTNTIFNTELTFPPPIWTFHLVSYNSHTHTRTTFFTSIELLHGRPFTQDHSTPPPIRSASCMELENTPTSHQNDISHRTTYDPNPSGRPFAGVPVTPLPHSLSQDDHSHGTTEDLNPSGLPFTREHHPPPPLPSLLNTHIIPFLSHQDVGHQDTDHRIPTWTAFRTGQ